jgi:hypothetical protein
MAWIRNNGLNVSLGRRNWIVPNHYLSQKRGKQAHRKLSPRKMFNLLKLFRHFEILIPQTMLSSGVLIYIEFNYQKNGFDMSLLRNILLKLSLFILRTQTYSKQSNCTGVLSMTFLFKRDSEDNT